MNIGDYYHREKNNCAHFVVHHFNIPFVPDEHALLWATRKYFRRIEKPENNCLVVCPRPLHIGVYLDTSVKHNCRLGGTGQLVRTPLALFKFHYKNLRFYRYVNHSTI